MLPKSIVKNSCLCFYGLGENRLCNLLIRGRQTMKKFLLFMACLFSTSVIAGNVAEYNPEKGSLEIPELIISGQEGEYLIKMRQMGDGLNFEVIEITPDESVEDSDEYQATYDPETRSVDIPLIAVTSKEESAQLKIFSVKMQQQEGLNFKVVEAITAVLKLKK